MDEIYAPLEDSYFLKKILEEKVPELLGKNQKLIFLEIGNGSGIQLQTVLRLGLKKENIFSCDINIFAVKYCRKLNFNCIKSDLFKKIERKFDLIIFNPPYLPKDMREPKNSRFATTGGKKGSEIINRFLKQAKFHLNENGRIFLLTSSLTKNVNFLRYKKRLIGEKKLFFEKLLIWELQ